MAKNRTRRKVEQPRSTRSAAAPSGMSTSELRAELDRRERSLASLVKKREKTAARLADIDREIVALGGEALAGRRPRNSKTLADALHAVLTGATMGVTEVAEAVQQAGYHTTSPNFRTIVNQTLLKDKRIKRVARGQYTAR
jgi:hypothetical protein